jgi:hypothetical protein
LTRVLNIFGKMKLSIGRKKGKEREKVKNKSRI